MQTEIGYQFFAPSVALIVLVLGRLLLIIHVFLMPYRESHTTETGRQNDDFCLLSAA